MFCEPKYVKDIDPGIRYEIQLLLAKDKLWEKMLTVSTKSSDFCNYVKEIEKTQHSDITKALLDYFSDFHLTDFIDWLEKIHLEKALLMLKRDVPLEIIQEPKCLNIVTADSNEKVTLLCKAKGFPTPRYQWYHNENILPNKQEPVLEIYPVKLEDAGCYYCQVYNISRIGIKTFVNTRKANIVIQPKDDNLPQIKSQSYSPTIQKVYPGKSFTLSCVVCSRDPVTYQWCSNGIKLEGECRNELIVAFHPDDTQIKYVECIVTNKHGSVLSNRVVFELQQEESSYFAMDKVALLIGINKYDHFSPLTQPSNDVTVLASNLKEIDFKTFSYLNLTRIEMMEAVQLFCNFIRPGVYALFYFAGHGFSQSGQSYLVTKEAEYTTSEESICSEYILKCMQEKNPAANIILLDICMKPPSVLPDKVIPEKIFKVGVLRNTIFGYATSFTYSCYERKDNNSVFVHYLKKHIKECISMWEMLLKVLADIENDPEVYRFQFPYLAGSLSRQLKLTDVVNGEGREFDMYSQCWKTLTSAPEDKVFPLKEFGITITLKFCNYLDTFCNALTVRLYMSTIAEDQSLLEKYSAFLQITSDVEIDCERKEILQNDGTKLCCCISIFNLQSQKFINGHLEVHDKHTKTLCCSTYLGLELPISRRISIGMESQN